MLGISPAWLWAALWAAAAAALIGVGYRHYRTRRKNATSRASSNAAYSLGITVAKEDEEEQVEQEEQDEEEQAARSSERCLTQHGNASSPPPTKHLE